MSSLPPNASRQEIEDEITFLQVSITTIDDEDEDAATTRQDLELQMQDLEQRLDALDTPKGANRPKTPENTLNGSFDGVNLPSRERERRPYSGSELGNVSP